MTLRIGVDARPLASRTGIGRYTREMLEHLIPGSDHEFFLYGVEDPKLTAKRFAWRALPALVPLSSSLMAQLFYPFWARHDRLDVFWSPRHHLPAGTGTALVVTIHDLVWRKVPETMTWSRRWAEKLLMPRALQVADRIIAISDSTRRDILDFAPAAGAKVRVVPGAPLVTCDDDPDEFTASMPLPQPYILFVGTLEPRKNVKRLLQAYRILIDEDVAAPGLVLAGGVGWMTDLPSLLHQLGLESRVRFVESPDDPTLVRLYQGAQFLVLPSLYEGFGLPLVEAMSFGKPVITSNRASMPEVAGSGGLLVDPTQIRQIARAMHRLITDRALYDHLAAEALAQASRYSWAHAAAATLEVLEQAAGSHRLA